MEDDSGKAEPEGKSDIIAKIKSTKLSLAACSIVISMLFNQIRAVLTNPTNHCENAAIMPPDKNALQLELFQ